MTILPARLPIPVVSVPIIFITGPTAATVNAILTINFCVSGFSFENFFAKSASFVAPSITTGVTTFNTELPKTVNEFFAELIAFLMSLVDVFISFRAFSVAPDA